MAERNLLQSHTIAGRSLKCPGLKPSDYFLFKEIRQYFGYDMRQVLVLGLRYLYAAWHDPLQREAILSIATTLNTENLDIQHESITYTPFHAIPHTERP